MNRDMETNKLLPKLKLPHGMTREIAEILHISERTVYSAVNGRVTGEKSAKARRLAELKLKKLDND